MTHVTLPDHLLTLAEWQALPEDERYRKAELVDGVVQLSPRPVSRHQRASARLYAQLDALLVPHGWTVLPDVDVVLVPAFPPLVRVPDLSIVALDLADREPANYSGEQVRVAVEIISPGSRRTDRIMKMADYGEAGIPDYWIIDLDDPVSLDAFRLVDGGYEPVLRGATGLVELDAPVPLVIDLAALVARR